MSVQDSLEKKAYAEECIIRNGSLQSQRLIPKRQSALGVINANDKVSGPTSLENEFFNAERIVVEGRGKGDHFDDKVEAHRGIDLGELVLKSE